MKHVFLLFAISLIVLNTSAQIDKEPLPAVEAEVIQINSGNSVYGKVMDIQSDKGVEAASVQLLAMIQKPGIDGEHRDGAAP